MSCGRSASRSRPTLRNNCDVSGSLGGPIKKDRLWFFGSICGSGAMPAFAMASSAIKYAGDADALGLTSAWTASRRVRPTAARSRNIRVTAQVAQKHRISFYDDHQRRCSGSTLDLGWRRLP